MAALNENLLPPEKLEARTQAAEATRTDAVLGHGESPKVEKPAPSDQVGREVTMNLEDLENDLSDKPPPTKKSRLDYEAIIMGEMLSDIHINPAQSLLKAQFIKLNGFEGTLYQAKKVNWTEEKIITNKVQIIHCKDRKHWILATTVDCPKDVVKVYDSFLDQETKKVIENLFTVGDSPLQIKVMKSQKQTGCVDCGVFSIANATAIAFGHNAAKLRLQQDTKERIFLVSVVYVIINQSILLCACLCIIVSYIYYTKTTIHIKY